MLGGSAVGSSLLCTRMCTMNMLCRLLGGTRMCTCCVGRLEALGYCALECVRKALGGIGVHLSEMT